MADNEVNIKITADDDTAAAAASTKAAAKGVGDEWTKAGKASAKASDDASKGMAGLSAQLNRSKRELADLEAAFHKTGDTDFLDLIKIQSQEVKNLSGWHKRLGGDVEESADDQVRGFGRISAKWGALSAGIQANGSTLTKALTNPFVLGGAAAAATIGIAGAAGAALAGFGVGLIGVGAIALRESARIKASARSVADTFKTMSAEAAAPLEDDLVDALQKLEGTADRAGPSLKRMFSSVQPAVGALAGGIDGLVSHSLPGLEDAAEGANDVLVDLGGELPELGDSISGLGSAMGESAEGGGKALIATLEGLEFSIGAVAKLMEGSAKAFDLWTEANPLLADALGVSDEAMKKQAESADKAGASSRQLAADEEEVAAKAKEQAEALEGAIAAMTDLGEVALRARDVERNYQEAVDDATESVKKNGKTLDAGTAAGRRNQSALDGIAAATLRKVGMDARAGASGNSLNGTMSRGRQAFISAATAMGLSAAKARALADALGLIPRNIHINVTTGLSGAIDSVRRAQGRLNAGMGRYEHGGIIGAAAGGGPRSGLTLVGESGPELADLPPGTQVHSNPDSMRMMAGGDGGPTNVVLSVAPGLERGLIAELLKVLRYEVHTTGRGSAQTLLGA